jgi:hypothetical protein
MWPSGFTFSFAKEISDVTTASGLPSIHFSKEGVLAGGLLAYSAGGHAAEALAWTKAVMTKLGLTINENKTSPKDARKERFDFLGYSFGPHYPYKGGICRGRENATPQPFDPWAPFGTHDLSIGGSDAEGI